LKNMTVALAARRPAGLLGLAKVTAHTSRSSYYASLPVAASASVTVAVAA